MAWTLSDEERKRCRLEKLRKAELHAAWAKVFKLSDVAWDSADPRKVADMSAANSAAAAAQKAYDEAVAGAAPAVGGSTVINLGPAMNALHDWQDAESRAAAAHDAAVASMDPVKRKAWEDAKLEEQAAFRAWDAASSDCTEILRLKALAALSDLFK